MFCLAVLCCSPYDLTTDEEQSLSPHNKQFVKQYSTDGNGMDGYSTYLPTYSHVFRETVHTSLMGHLARSRPVLAKASGNANKRHTGMKRSGREGETRTPATRPHLL